MFELSTATKVKVLDVRTLSRKDRKPDELPGAQLLLAANLSSDVLAMFDGLLPGMLYQKAGGAKQGALEGMEGQELTAIGEHVKRLPWQYEQTGCTLVCHWATTKLELEDCKAHRVLISPREGGGCLVQWTVDAPGLSDATRGKLTGLKSTEVDITMVGPEVAQQDIEAKPPAPAPAPKPAAAPAAEGKNWPFPKNGAANEPAGPATPEDALAAGTPAPEKRRGGRRVEA